MPDWVSAAPFPAPRRTLAMTRALAVMNSHKMISRSIITIRLFLSAVFIMYGGVKLLGGQFYYGDWVLDKKTTDGTGLVWAFYGFSPFYGRVVGLFEFIPALLLLSRRTTTLGALALFAVSLNITLMDFAFNFPPVKYYAALYTVLCGVLLAHDRKKLALLFWNRERISEI